MLNSLFEKIVRSLHFQHDYSADLRAIEESQWPALLELTDRARLTLALGVRRRDCLPNSVRTRIDHNLASNAVRHQLLIDEYRLIEKALRARSVDFVVLKGFSQIAPLYACDARHRPQYDLDLFCPSEALDTAWSALAAAGFTPVHARGNRTDHLPPLIRNTNWNWRGDYYAPDLPLTVELHFQFWDRQTERLGAPGVGQFWERRSNRSVDGMEIPMLSLPDGVSYTALHLMRHLLRGDLRIYHAYELAHFLHQTAGDDELWSEWRSHRVAQPSLIEATAFRLAVEWFGCRAHPVVEEKMASLPPKIQRWFTLFAGSPLRLAQSNKDELFLHLSMVSNPLDRCAIVMRRLAPLNAPKLVQPAVGSLGKPYRQAFFVARRALHHIRTALPLVGSLGRYLYHRL